MYSAISAIPRKSVRLAFTGIAALTFALAGCKQTPSPAQSVPSTQSSAAASGAPSAEPAAPLPAQPAGVTVPFVGCKSDGPQGPQDAPGGKEMSLPLTAEAARQLAYYEAEVGVLAPRGWHCFGAYSSGGSELYVSPEPLSGAEVLSRSWNGLTGPAIELAVSDGNTAGRLDVARVIARVFPEQKAFVNEVIKEERLPAGDLSYGPYAADKLTYRGKTIVEYKTPADTEGLGTMSRLKKDAGPIDGVAILLGQTPPGLVQLSVRLPANLSAFTPTIIQQTERDTATATGSH